MNAIELFAGAGGLGMGLTLAGFKADAVVEWDKWACDTIRQNKERGFPLVMDWPLVEADVRDWINAYSASRPGPVDLVAGGPPCQPFSMGCLPGELTFELFQAATLTNRAPCFANHSIDGV